MAERRAPSAFIPKHRADYSISVIVLILIAIGLIMIYSTGWITILKQTGGSVERNSFFFNQLISFGLGIAGWIIGARVRYTFWQKYASLFFYGSALLMVLVVIPGIGVTINGANRWVHFGPINFQPVEFFKLGIILFFAAWIEKNREKLNRPIEGLLPMLLILSASLFVVVLLQKDMGSAIVIASAVLGMYFISGVDLKIFGIAIASLFGGGILLVATSRYRLARYITFLNRGDDSSGAGYHINQALIALGSGGFFGRGLGKSLQAYGYLPEATNDSIFAIIGEEFGFVGCLVIIGLYVGLLWRGYKIISRAPDEYAKLVATGIIIWIVFQAFFNIAAMGGIIPLTGIPLPFISYGGTSLLALLIAVGILQNISKYTKGADLDVDRGLRRGNRRAHRANSGRRRRPAAV